MKNVKFKDWNCKLRFRKYQNGRTAIELVDAINGEPIAMATVNIPECALEEDEVIIKNYSENEGMLDALIGAGIIERTNKVGTGFNCVICKLKYKQ